MKKKLLLLIPLMLLASFLLLESENLPLRKTLFSFRDNYRAGILKSEFKKIDNIASYNFDVNFFADSKTIDVKEKITWINKTPFETNQIQFHLYANAYKSNRTLFAKEFPLTEKNKTEFKIEKCQIDGKSRELVYFWPDKENVHDSTVAKILLDKNVKKGDSVIIYFEYKLKIPLAVRRMGYASGKNFVFIAQWFPKVGVFENGEWICSQYHPLQNFYSNFGTYNAKITVPQNYIVASTGVSYNKINDGKRKTYFIHQAGVHEFAWCASDDFLIRKDIYTRQDGSQVEINAYIQPEQDEYTLRFIDAVKNSMKYMEENVGIYPYQSISLINVPKTCSVTGMEYPTLFTTGAEMFARPNTGQPETITTHEFSHQYFYGLLANNEVYEAWLDEGFSSYMSTKILYEYYQPILETFKIINHFPLYGINFFSFKDIPIIYTLADIFVTEGSRSTPFYYQNLTLGAIADTSFKLPTRLSYRVNSYYKPELMLLSLERYLGKEKMRAILKDYYQTYKYKHPKAKDFINIVYRNVREDMHWFFDEIYNSSKVFDYKVSSVVKLNDNAYEVLVERLGDGIFKTDVALYTDKNILVQKWDGKEKWKKFIFKTQNSAYAAEVDPKLKNLLDVNIANNSYTINKAIGGALSLSVRWFFWVQNALMILGGFG